MSHLFNFSDLHANPMVPSSPIIDASYDEDEDVQVISATTSSQNDQREVQAKAGVASEQPLSHEEVTEDQRAAMAKLEEPRAKFADSLTHIKDHDLDTKRSSSVPQPTTRGTRKQFLEPSRIVNHVTASDRPETNDLESSLGSPDPPSLIVRLALKRTGNAVASITQPKMGQHNPQPSMVNDLPQKRKSGGDDGSTRKRSKAANSTNTASNTTSKKVVAYDSESSSCSSTTSESSSGYQSDPTYHPPDEEPQKPVPKWIQMRRAGLPLKLHIFADLANQLWHSFDFTSFAEQYNMPVADIMDIFSAVVLMPCIDFNQDGRKTMPELWKKITENLPAMERAIQTIDGPEKKKSTTDRLVAAIRKSHEMKTRGGDLWKKK